MKTTLRILTVLLALCASRAQADYTISASTSPPQTASPGQSGTSYFDFVFNGGTFAYSGKQLWAVDGADPDNNPLDVSPFSHLAVDTAASTLHLGSGNSYLQGQTYRVVVDWTISSTLSSGGNYGIYFNLFAKQPDLVPANAGATDLVNIRLSSVPEPPQTLAGSVVLGCGLLLGVGRRLFKKPLV